MAWLHATPEGSKKSRLKSFKDLDENSSFLKLPDIEGAEYLVALLSEVGFVSNTGMGITHLSWTEINSWITCTQLELSIFEKLLLREMSEVYANELNAATAKDRPAPYIAPSQEDVDLEAQRKAVANKLRSVFNSFKRSNTGEPESQN